MRHIDTIEGLGKLRAGGTAMFHNEELRAVRLAPDTGAPCQSCFFRRLRATNRRCPAMSACSARERADGMSVKFIKANAPIPPQEYDEEE